MKKILLLICAISSMNVQSQAKVKKQLIDRKSTRSQNTAAMVNPMYAFSTFTAPYNAISGTTLTGGQKWDDFSYVVPVGFTFTLYASSGTALNLAWGGQLITFDDPDNGPYVSFAAAMFEDLCDRAFIPATDNEGDAGGISPISYTTVGSPGSRICKIQVTNAGFYGENDAYSTSTSYVNWQIWLYETINRIEFRYGAVDIQNPADNVLNGATGFVTGLADSIDVNTGDAPTSNMLDGPYANPSVFPWTNAISTYVAGAIDSGRVYRFDRVVTTALKNSDNSKIISIYPNPSRGKITLKGIDLNEAQVSINDLNGKQMNTLLVAKNNSVDVSELKEGVYYMQINTKEATITKKIVICK
jgi:hypothetical protein